jgi:hypothetical protein
MFYERRRHMNIKEYRKNTYMMMIAGGLVAFFALLILNNSSDQLIIASLFGLSVALIIQSARLYILSRTIEGNKNWIIEVLVKFIVIVVIWIIL